jgi:hypothetical protein
MITIDVLNRSPGNRVVEYKNLPVRLITGHSNIKIGEPIEIKPGYFFIFLTPVGFCFSGTQIRFNTFKDARKIEQLLSSFNLNQNNSFRLSTNGRNKPMTYNYFKSIYSPGMVAPEHEIEFAKVLPDIQGIYHLPLNTNFSEISVKTKWNILLNEIYNETNITMNKKSDNNKKAQFSKQLQLKIKNFLKFKNEEEKRFGKLSHRTYGSVNIKNTSDFRKKYHSELKKVPGGTARADRTLSTLMDKQSEFYIPPGVYFIGGCRTIGFENEPAMFEGQVSRASGISNLQEGGITRTPSAVEPYINQAAMNTYRRSVNLNSQSRKKLNQMTLKLLNAGKRGPRTTIHPL